MYLENAYSCGMNAALTKLGAVAGPIAYAPRAEQENHTLSDKNMQLAWLDADREPALSTPTTPGGDKTAGLSDGGYSGFSDGEYGAGSSDADRLRPDTELRKTDAIRRAFVTNENIDQSFGPEAAITQPQGSKYAALRNTLQKTAMGSTMGIGLGGGGGGGMGGGLGGGLRSAGLGSTKSMMGPGGSMGIPAPKPMQARDPRADKPPGMNLQHAVQTTSGISDMGTSIGSRFRRMDGNPM